MVIVQNGEHKMKLFEKLKKDQNTEPKFSFRDALGNMKSAVLGKASDMRAGYKSKADQAMQSDEMLDLSSKLRMHKNKVRIAAVRILTLFLCKRSLDDKSSISSLCIAWSALLL